MNPAQLLAHFANTTDAPDAVPRLRRFILDLAVRGKLVPQNPRDESAAELLKRITAEKDRLIKARVVKNDKPLPEVSDETPFDVPATWVWTRLGKVASYIQRGKSPKYAAADGSLVVSQKCVQWSVLDLKAAKRIAMESLTDYEEARFLRSGDLLWNSTGTGTIGRVIHLIDPPEKLVCDSHATVVRCLRVDPIRFFMDATRARPAQPDLIFRERYARSGTLRRRQSLRPRAARPAPVPSAP